MHCACCRCEARREIVVRPFGLSVGVNPCNIGHWLSEQLGHVLLLHDHLPRDTPILVADCPAVRRYLQALVGSGALPRHRLWLAAPSALRNSTVRAASVYALAHSHFSYVTAGDGTQRRARDAFAFPRGASIVAHLLRGLGSGVWLREARPTLLVMDRGDRFLAPRAFANSKDVLRALAQAVAAREAARDGSGRSGLGGGVALEIVRWKPLQSVQQDVVAFRRAALIVAPHGAGLANILFARPGTPVIEVCYDNNASAVSRLLGGASFPAPFPCPNTLALLGANLGLPYWVVTGAGTIASPLLVDVDQLREAAAQALELVAPTPPLDSPRNPTAYQAQCRYAPPCKDEERQPPSALPAERAPSHHRPHYQGRTKLPVSDGGSRSSGIGGGGGGGGGVGVGVGVSGGVSPNDNLAVLIGSLRGGELAWRSLDENVLRPNRADLALMIGDSGPRGTLLHRLARYVWTIPERKDWGEALDDVARRMHAAASVESAGGAAGGARHGGARDGGGGGLANLSAWLEHRAHDIKVGGHDRNVTVEIRATHTRYSNPSQCTECSVHH